MTDPIRLTEEKETLFITLSAKALDNRSANPILYDQAADDLLKKISYDLTRYQGFGDRVIVVRAKQFDEWIKEFLSKNKNAIVVYMGCGLDTRIDRINPSPDISWFDVDYPDVITLRKTFYSEREGYGMISSSVTETDWLKAIPSDRPTLIIAEGLLEYLMVDEVKELFLRLTSHFRHGEILFDVMNSFAIESGKEKLKKTTGAVHKWAVNDTREVDNLNPQFKKITDISLFDSPFIKKLPLGLRLLLGVATLIPIYKNMIRLLRYRF